MKNKHRFWHFLYGTSDKEVGVCKSESFLVTKYQEICKKCGHVVTSFTSMSFPKGLEVRIVEDSKMEKIKKIIQQWLKEEGEGSIYSFIGDTEDLSRVTLDGQLNLEKLAKMIHSAQYDGTN